MKTLTCQLSDFTAFWLQHPHQKIYDVRTGSLYKINLNKKGYYLKIYKYPKFSDVRKIFFRGGVFGKSRAKVEYNNLKYLYQKGLAPQPLLLLEKKKWMLLRNCFLILEEIPNAVNMDHFIFSRLPQFSKKQRCDFIEALALATKKMNKDGFVNGEYHWRNILVVEENNNFKFYIIDCCKRRFLDKFLIPHRDLASLDIYAENFFSNEERLIFLKIYLGVKEISSKHKKLIKNIEKLKQKMLPKEWKRYKFAHEEYLKNLEVRESKI